VPSESAPQHPRALREPEDVRLAQAAAADWRESAGAVWQDAADVYAHLVANSNHVDAVGRVPWGRLLPPQARVLDLGCGAGWVTALLSARDEVAEVVAWDGSYRLLSEGVPQMLALLGGDSSKVRTVCGDFIPLLQEDSSLDVVVMASAFHHADRPQELLAECHRVLRKGGRLLLLNEVPYSVPSMLRYVSTTAVGATLNALTARAAISRRGSVSVDGILYDENLGDRAMTMSQWRRVLAGQPFAVEVFGTGLPPYKPEFRKPAPFERKLTHFFLQKL
jgi:SAM-dependent methyltransferase